MPGDHSGARDAAGLASQTRREWQYQRIHGEPTKLGVTAAPSTAYEILRSSPDPVRVGTLPDTSFRTYPESYLASQIASMMRGQTSGPGGHQPPRGRRLPC